MTGSAISILISRDLANSLAGTMVQCSWCTLPFVSRAIGHLLIKGGGPSPSLARLHVLSSTRLKGTPDAVGTLNLKGNPEGTSAALACATEDSGRIVRPSNSAMHGNNCKVFGFIPPPHFTDPEFTSRTLARPGTPSVCLNYSPASRPLGVH